jgi:nitrogen regulatory protein PII
MKLVTAIVRSEKLDEIIDAVLASHGKGLTVTAVRGFGQQFGVLAGWLPGAGPAEDASPRQRRAVLLNKVRLDILVADDDVQGMVDAIGKHARTGDIGDGKVWVCPVESALRVRTGERDRDAV